MDALLSQLKGQGSPFSSPFSKPNNVDKLLDTIHLLSQATVLVAHQLQEQNTPVKAKPHREAHLPTPPLTPKSSPAPSAKKTPPPKPSATMLSWVPRAPEYYRLPPPIPLTTHSSVPIPTKRTSHTKKDRKPKSKRTNPSTQPTPSPNPLTTPATLRPTQPDLKEPVAPANPTPTPLPTPRPVQTDQRDPPTPSPSTLSSHTETREETKARLKARSKAKHLARALLRSPTPTPLPNHHDDVAPVPFMAPANDVVNFPHPYDDCPRLPECPAHQARFAVSCQAYADRTRGAPLPPLYPQPRDEESGFELRCERDTTWWPEVPPSDSPSPPGTPADPFTYLTIPNDPYPT